MLESLDDDSGALPRALAVLRHIAGSPRPLGNRELCELTGIPKASTSRITARLAAAGLIRQAPGAETFQLGPAVLDLSRAFLEQLDMRAVVRPHLATLSEETGVAAHLGLRDRLEIVLVEAVQPRIGALITRLGVGSRMSMARSAAGRAYLAGLPETERAGLLATLTEAGALDNAALPALEQAFAQIAELGYCTSFGEWAPEVNAIGTYLRGPDGEAYCITCGGPSYRFTPELLAGPVAQRLTEAVARICAESGATGPATGGRPVQSFTSARP